MTVAQEKNPPVKLPNEPAITPQIVAEHGLLALHPLCGGVDPETAWPYLRRAVAAAT